MGKRFATKPLEREDFENGNEGEQNNQEEEVYEKDDASTIANRKIFKAKRSTGQEPSAPKETKSSGFVLSGNLDSAQPSNAPKTGLFGAPLTASANQSSLFGDKAQSSNIFGSANNKDESKSLFGASFKPAPTTSLFGSITESTSLFGNTTGGQIFNSGKANIFDNAKSNKEENKNEHSDGCDPENDGEKNSSSLVAHNKTTIAAPDSPYTKVLQFEKIDKLKIVSPQSAIQSLGQGRLSIERGVIKDKLQFLCVLRSRTGRSLYIGQLSLQNSKKKRIEEKSYRNQLKVAFLFTDPSDKKPKVSFVKINFSRFEDMEKFEEEFEKAMKELKEFPAKD